MTLSIVLIVVLCAYVLTRPRRRLQRHSLSYRLYLRFTQSKLTPPHHHG